MPTIKGMTVLVEYHAMLWEKSRATSIGLRFDIQNGRDPTGRKAEKELPYWQQMTAYHFNEWQTANKKMFNMQPEDFLDIDGRMN